MKMDLQKQPHRRLNLLTREWVLVSPQRTERPWQGQVEKTSQEELPRYDPNCYLCPGNVRANGERNPQYKSTFVFENDFAALRPDAPFEKSEHRLLIAEGEPGTCRVVCFSPRHDLTISLMGASNPHPHCQVWAEKSLPNETVKEIASMLDYAQDHRSCLLCDYLSVEREQKDRLVCDNNDFAAVVPFWAVWPFEILIVSRRHITGVDQLNGGERASLADILKQVTSRYDRLFSTSFPYTMGFHQRPTDGEDHLEYHLHAHFFPPLLRSATVRKFMVGYEMLAMPQRDITAEEAAARLRKV